MPLNVADTTLARLELAELQQEAGRKAEAGRELRQFLAAWPRAHLPPGLARRVDALAPEPGRSEDGAAPRSATASR